MFRSLLAGAFAAALAFFVQPFITSTASAQTYQQIATGLGIAEGNSIAADADGNLYVASAVPAKLWLVQNNHDGSYTKSPLQTDFASLNSVVIDLSGDLYVSGVDATTEASTIWKIPAADGYMSKTEIYTDFSEGFAGLAIDSEGKLLFSISNAIVKIDPANASTPTVVSQHNSSDFIAGLAFDANYDLLVNFNSGIIKLLASDDYSFATRQIIAPDSLGLRGLAVDSSGHAYSANLVTHHVEFWPVPSVGFAQNYATSSAGGQLRLVYVDASDNVFAPDINGNLYRVAARPAVTGLSPSSGPEAGGSFQIDVTGKRFTLDMTFDFLGSSTQYSESPGSDFATHWNIYPALHGTGTMDIRVVTPGGGESLITQQGRYTFVPAPTVTGLSVNTGPGNGGTTVVITGTNFSGSFTSVKFGTASAPAVSVDSDTQITATSPQNFGVGTVDVTVTTRGGTSATSSDDEFTYLNPKITAVSPAGGPASGGTPVRIFGDRLDTVTGVKFGSETASITESGNPGEIKVAAPGQTAATVDVVVTTSEGATTKTNAYTYFAAPTVTSVSPNIGPSVGGTSVTITGTNFTGATGVTFLATPASNVIIDSDTQITATSPAGSAGTVHIVVTNPGGSNPQTAADQFTYVDGPTINSVSPASGPTGGNTTVIITGTNLGGVSDVEFGAQNAASFTPLSSTQVRAVTPSAASAGAVVVRVSTPGGTVTKSDAFTYAAAPTITAINPNQGPATGGTQVTIVGANLTGATGVKFGAKAATSFSVNMNGTSGTATAPSGTANQAVNVTIATPGGTSAAANGNKFTYRPAPVATTLIKFAGGANDGGKPFGGLVADAAGVLYGTTSMGGKFNKGVIFKLTPSGNTFTKTILFHFDGTKGATPYATLAIDSAKNLYGTTTAGGPKNKGVIFKLAGTTYTVLYNFKGDATDGGVPYAGLARHSNGTLYGFTSAGGQKNFGTAFKLTPPSTFAVTHHFTGATGENPRGTPFLDKNNNVYGAAVTGGAPDQGLVFKIAPNNARTALYTFLANGSTGKQPFGALTSPNTNGTMFFGTTFAGGQQNKGAVVDVMPPSTGLLLFSFGGTNGANPYAGPTVDPATTILFGTTFNGGATSKGVVYRLDPPANLQPNWTQSVMYSFKGGTADGANPYAGLLLRNKILYGTTSAGGTAACTGGCGTVFKVTY